MINKNEFKIGLDLDNTVIDYSEAYKYVSDLMKLNIPIKTRSEIKNFFNDSVEGDLGWQKFQSILYTDAINYAQVSNGLYNFLEYCYLNEINLYIISHKTKKTSIRYNDLDLRKLALKWLKDNNIVPKYIKLKNVIFKDSQKEKIQAINDLKINVFVDDLPEIINSNELNKETIGILFSNERNNNSLSSFNELIEKVKSWT